MGVHCNKSFKKMFWKKAEGGRAACHILHKWAISSSTAPCGQGAHKGVSISVFVRSSWDLGSGLEYSWLRACNFFCYTVKCTCAIMVLLVTTYLSFSSL
jgi:hypothetical protein